MKKKILLWSMLIGIFTVGNAQIIFPDANFKQALLDHTSPIIDTNSNGEISITEALAVKYIDVRSKYISDLTGIEEFINLEILRCRSNQLSNLDITQNTKLTSLYCGSNQLSSLDVTQNKNLIELTCPSNQLLNLDVTQNTNLVELSCYSNLLTSLDVNQNTNLESLSCDANQLSSLDLTQNTNLKSLSCVANQLSNLDVSQNLNLKTLLCFTNQLTSLDVTQNINLTRLDCYINPLNTLDVTQNTNLEILGCSSNQLSTLDVTQNRKLTFLHCGSNQLSSLDITKNTNLEYLSSFSNQLTTLDVNENINLKLLFCYSNQLASLDLTHNTRLEDLRCQNNQLSSLDVRPCQLTELRFNSNPNLETVYMAEQPISYKTVSGEEVLGLTLYNCPNLQFICADQGYLSDLYNLLESADQTSCLLSSDCATPLNHIPGTVTYDLDKDGCDTNDIPFTQYIGMNIFSGSGESITVFPNEEGQYNAFLNDGAYKIIPDLGQSENYFQILNPPVFNFFEPGTTIPDDIANLTTDFCIQALDDFDDLEVSIVPINRAQPGFDTTYQIMYTNNGTTTQSGTITLEYDSDVLVFDSATPDIVSNINGQLTWSFNGLSPMETVQIPVTFILNTPMDTPALNGGEVLNYTATIIGATDETSDNNVMTLAQTVVNSYDPNDKTCLEGDILDPDDVGRYLHYLIRFENEGTAEARNITVTDIIDTTKLDIESFVPLTSSHSYTTTISNENKVEFLFSNINLPFDDANNDGYVIFKIKTLDTLVEGDEIVNSAAIYFDFNFPILTEDSVVSVEREIVVAPSFSDYFTLSPNPTTGIMNLGVLDDSVEINYIVLYDLTGVFRGFYFGTIRTIDVSNLYARTYVMQILTNKGDFSTQFIKL